MHTAVAAILREYNEGLCIVSLATYCHRAGAGAVS
jgi:hypothetical protein